MRTTTLVLTLAGCLALAACGERADDETGNGADGTAANGAAADAMPPPVEEGSQPTAAPDGVEQRLDEALAGEHRADGNADRDRYRNPTETLMFFGLEPDMTVLELYPGAGWYTEVLAPVLREDGRLVAGQFDPEQPPDYRARVVAEYDAKLAGHPAYEGTEVAILADGEALDLGDAESFDMVLTFRNIHSWINDEQLETVFAEVARVLKPGGVLGIVQHRADEGVDPIESAKRGYVPESYVVEQAEAAGLVLEERAEINANPDDSKDYDRGVWALPPTLAGEMDDRDARLATGESDRMTLRFRKPTS